MTFNAVEKKLGRFSLNVNQLDISAAGIYGLVGPNGSGKTTLAKLMAGLIEPDTGVIDRGALGPRDITFLSRKPYMMNDTVFNNLVFPLKLRNVKINPALASEYLAMMGFSGKEKQKARSLSSGEQQKLGLLRALIFKPRLIIADEAMTALDIDSLDLFENFILESQKKDPVIWIIISHQMTHVRRLASRFFFMYGGRVEYSGTMEEMLANTSNPHLEQYLRVYNGGSGTPDSGKKAGTQT
jgi:ABC-type multidrug transport system ATPase subunit